MHPHTSGHLSPAAAAFSNPSLFQRHFQNLNSILRFLPYLLLVLANRLTFTFGYMVKFSSSMLKNLERALNAGQDVEAPARARRTRLHGAVEDRDLARVQLLLRFGANVNARDTDGRSPMHLVAKLPTLEDERRRVHPTLTGELEDEETRAEIIKLLLATGADPNARDIKEDTPLSVAYRYGRPCCVRALIDAGANPSIYRKDCGAPIPAFVVDLIRNPDGAQVVASMLATGVGVNEKGDDGHTLLDRAAFCGSPSAVTALLDAGADPLAETDRAPLRSVAMLMKSDGGEEAAMALIKAGARVDGDVWMHALEYRSSAAIRLLLAADVDPDGLHGHILWAAVARARNDDDHDVIKALLEGGVDVNGPKNAQDRPLHLASKRGHASTVRLLLESGADRHLRNAQGQTALQLAAKHKCTATISVLLEAEVDPNVRGKLNNGCWPPLHLAAQSHQPLGIIQLLLKAGADPRNCGPGGRTALHSALEAPGCTDEVLSALLDAGADPNAKDSGGETPLHYAVQYQCSASATLLLLKSGADPHAREHHGRTPLFCATFTAERSDDWVQHVAVLRNVGADIDDSDVNGVTPLSYALSRQSVNTACSLLRLGADPYAGHAYTAVAPRFVISLIGKINIESIVAIVTRGHLHTDEQDQFLSSGDLSEPEKEECKVLVCASRERMLAQPASEREGFIALLSILYGMLGHYPSDPPIHECEVALPPGRPTHFGGFADCWKGLFLGRHTIAMKTFRSALAKDVGTRRLAREAKVWSHLSHPNVLPFLGLCTLDSVPYLISPWMENGHALNFVQKQPNVDRLRLLAQVADGLEYLHSFKPQPVVHGDLRGPNILISTSGNACIADFGLSELKTDTYETNYSTPFIVAGNPRWQAPEIIRAETTEEARRKTTTDIFAFGRVMLEFFTGKVPFFYFTHDAMAIAMILNGEFPRRPDDDEVVARGLDESMWQLMVNCWHTIPSERPSAADLVSRLAAALDSRSASKQLVALEAGADVYTEARSPSHEDSSLEHSPLSLGDDLISPPRQAREPFPTPRHQEKGIWSMPSTRLRGVFSALKRKLRQREH